MITDSNVQIDITVLRATTKGKIAPIRGLVDALALAAVWRETPSPQRDVSA